MKQMHVIEERKIQKLQKKLQIAEETISSLSTSHEAELRAKEEILQQYTYYVLFRHLLQLKIDSEDNINFLL